MIVMKKLLVWLCLLVMAVSSLALAEDANVSGVWAREFVDGDPNDWYIYCTEPMEGQYFRKSADGNPMQAVIVLTDGKVGLRLWEDGTKVVSNRTGRVRNWNLTVKDKDWNTRRFIPGRMAVGSDTIVFDEEASEPIYEALLKGGMIFFVVMDEKNSSDSYSFCLDNADGLAALLSAE